MPHVIIEHQLPKDIDLAALSLALHKTMSTQESVQAESVKTRTVSVKNVFIGTRSSHQIDSFVHITLLLLPGRSEELKKAITNNIFSAANIFFAKPIDSITVELKELCHYKKL